MFAKKGPKNDVLYIFEKFLTMQFSICKKKCANYFWCIKIICQILYCKTCEICFLMSKVFQKAKSYQNMTSESGSKQRFSLLQGKAVIQAVCLRTQAVSIKARFLGLNGGLWMFRKSQKISTASDQYFLSYVKKIQGGGVKMPLPQQE